MTPLFARLKSQAGGENIVNLNAIVEVVPAGTAACTLYFSNNCMAHGETFLLTPEILAEAAIEPLLGDDSLIDLTFIPTEAAEDGEDT